MKKTNILLVGLVLLSAMFAFYPQLFKLYKLSAKVACVADSQFKNDTGLTGNNSEANIINESGTVHYFKDDFSGYQQNSKIVDQFDNADNISFQGNAQATGLIAGSVSGEKAFSFQIKPEIKLGEKIVIRKNLAEPIDLTRWKESGILSLWMNLENRKGISEVGLKIGDDSQNSRDYGVVTNYQIDLPNNFDGDDVYPDIILGDSPNNESEWTDYWLNKGWNYLFWKAN